MKRRRPRTPTGDAPGNAAAVGRAFDELRFGPERTLNLREILPTPDVATARADSWLREQQVAGAGEVLVITGRGNSSPGGVSPVRAAVRKLGARLRRAGVIDSIAEHNPGAFVIRIAPITRLFDSPKSRRHPTPPTPLDARAFAGLSPDTVTALRDLSERSLNQLGVRSPTAAVLRNEMERRFSLLAVAAGEGPGGEASLQQAIHNAIRELEDQ